VRSGKLSYGHCVIAGGYGVHVILWEFSVHPEKVSEFVAAYRSDGDWAKLFQLSEGYLWTELLSADEDQTRFVTIDLWRSAEDFHRFQESFGDRYKLLDARLEGLTRKETQLGAFTTGERNSGTAVNFAEAVAIMHRLRAPGGCPWDREQTFETIRKYTLEETYEVFDAIERRDWPELKDELGDLLLQVLFYAEMAAEEGHFTIREVINGLNRKLIRRHPHVFGEEAAARAGNSAAGLETDGIDAAQVLRNWEEIKKREREQKAVQGPDSAGAGRLEGIPRSMPALMEAAKLGSKAAKAGFDWPDVSGLVAKLREETAELEAEIVRGEEARARAGEELGDLLFTAVNLARHLKVDPELALRDTNARFRSRFGAMEQESALPLEELKPEELERLWANAKRNERGV
jgi:nucleoside triphosphate diphosphatase